MTSIVAPPGQRLTFRHESVARGMMMRRYWTAKSVCGACPWKARCTPSTEQRIGRWKHEATLEKIHDRLDRNPDAMRVRRSTVEHPFGTIKAWMGATHFLCRTLPKVASEMALCVLGYNLTRVLNIVGMKPLLAAVRVEGGRRRRSLARRTAPTMRPGASRSPRDKKSPKPTEFR